MSGSQFKDTILMDEATESVQLSDGAVEEIKRIRVDDAVPENLFLRVGVKGGGCSGMSYTLGFDERKDHDLTLDCNGVQVIVDKRQIIYLGGTRVDFQNGLDNRGFTFTNPKATTTCGCGTSFST